MQLTPLLFLQVFGASWTVIAHRPLGGRAVNPCYPEQSSAPSSHISTIDASSSLYEERCKAHWDGFFDHDVDGRLVEHCEARDPGLAYIAAHHLDCVGFRAGTLADMQLTPLLFLQVFGASWTVIAHRPLGGRAVNPCYPEQSSAPSSHISTIDASSSLYEERCKAHWDGFFDHDVDGRLVEHCEARDPGLAYIAAHHVDCVGFRAGRLADMQLTPLLFLQVATSVALIAATIAVASPFGGGGGGGGGWKMMGGGGGGPKGSMGSPMKNKFRTGSVYLIKELHPIGGAGKGGMMMMGGGGGGWKPMMGGGGGGWKPMGGGWKMGGGGQGGWMGGGGGGGGGGIPSWMRMATVVLNHGGGSGGGGWKMGGGSGGGGWKMGGGSGGSGWKMGGGSGGGGWKMGGGGGSGGWKMGGGGGGGGKAGTTYIIIKKGSSSGGGGGGKSGGMGGHLSSLTSLFSGHGGGGGGGGHVGSGGSGGGSGWWM
ncbi:uncharacterized protein [Dermacentor albipictus]|uniref:uncharacterized protein n=1 Tax=Dermacentor albipictus TaxID=60249 RepID=UPI0038FD03D5